MLPERSPLLESAHVDVRAIGFTLALSVISALVFAILPAVKGSRWTPGPSLTARVISGEGNRWRNAMIAIEAALSVFLLCGAGLVAQNLWTLISTPMGFDPNHVLAMRLQLPPHQPNTTLTSYLEKIAAIPGVDSTATVTGPPLRQAIAGPSEIVGETDQNGQLKSVIADVHQVSPDYFRALRIPLLAGRAFRNDDSVGRLRVAIVNQEFARRFGLGPEVVGRQVFEPGEPFTIVGMAGNVRTRGLQTAPFPEIYISSLQFPSDNVYVVVRSAIPPAQLLRNREVRDPVLELRPGRVWRPDHGRTDCRLRHRAAFRRVPHRRLRAARRGDGRDRNVQRHLLPGLAAHQRNRHPHRLGRRPWRHRQDCSRYHEPLGSSRAGVRPRLGTGRAHHYPVAH